MLWGHGRDALEQPSRFRGALIALSAGLLMGACAGGGNSALSLNQQWPSQAAHQEQTDPRAELDRAVAYWGQQYTKDPRDKKAALSYALNLKAAGRKQTALTVLQQAAQYHGRDREIASEYGRLALEFGHVALAEKLLAIAYDPQNPDWRVISAQGTVLAKQENFAGAIPYYERALQLAPEQPSLVNNLAMALAAKGQPGKAEPLLRRAAAHPEATSKVRQNLALVMGLQGKSAEAEHVRMAGAPATASGHPAGAGTAGNSTGANQTLRPSVRERPTVGANTGDWPARVAAARRY